MTIDELEQYRKKLDDLTLITRGCWWYEGTKQNGRGVMRIGKKMKNVQTMAWELRTGEELPEGMVIKASCTNLLCVNPEHLELGRRTFGWLS